MFRDATARTVLSVLAATLLDLHFSHPTHTLCIRAYRPSGPGQWSAPGIKPSGPVLRDESVICRDASHRGDPTSPLRTCDQYRTTAASAHDCPHLREGASKPDDPGQHPYRTPPHIEILSSPPPRGTSSAPLEQSSPPPVL